MIEGITEIDSIGLVLLAVIVGAGYALASAGQHKFTSDDYTGVRWRSVGRVALEGAVGGVIVVLSGDVLGIEALEAAAPAAAIYVDKIVTTYEDLQK